MVPLAALKIDVGLAQATDATSSGVGACVGAVGAAAAGSRSGFASPNTSGLLHRCADAFGGAKSVPIHDRPSALPPPSSGADGGGKGDSQKFVEVSPEGRYHRSDKLLGHGTFKRIYQAYGEHNEDLIFFACGFESAPRPVSFT